MCSTFCVHFAPFPLFLHSFINIYLCKVSFDFRCEVLEVFVYHVAPFWWFESLGNKWSLHKVVAMCLTWETSENQSCFICTTLVRGEWRWDVCSPHPLPACLLRRELCMSLSFTAAPPRPRRRRSNRSYCFLKEKVMGSKGLQLQSHQLPHSLKSVTVAAAPPHPAPALAARGSRSAVLTSPSHPSIQTWNSGHSYLPCLLPFMNSEELVLFTLSP